MVDDDLHVKCFRLDNALNGLQIDPQVVRIEDLEFANALEFVNLLPWLHKCYKTMPNLLNSQYVENLTCSLGT